MAEIVGEDPAARLQRTCPNCAGIVEFTRRETETRSHTDMGGDTEFFDVIICPRCEYFIEVEQ